MNRKKRKRLHDIGRQPEIPRDRYTDRMDNGHTPRRIEGKTERPKDRKTERQTAKYEVNR